MRYITDNIVKAIWQFFAGIASDAMKSAFKLIVETIINTTDINKYINVNDYLIYVKVIAGSLLVIAIVWEGLKQQSGGVFNTSERSLSVLSLKTVFAGTLIFILPWSVTNMLLPLNNALIGLIQSIGFKITEAKFSPYQDLTANLCNLGILMILLGLILSIGFLILAIAGGIRYIELFLCIMIAPIAAISVVKDGEGLQIWLRETICIIFTQSIHILLLEVLMKIMSSVSGVMMIVLSIGTIAVMLKGPQVLRTFLYTSGVGSSTVSAVGSAGRMAAMKTIMKAPLP